MSLILNDTSFLLTGQYSGSIDRMQQADGLIASITSYAAEDCNPAFHYHANTVISFMLQGGNIEHRKQISHERRVGDLAFFHSGEWHQTLPGQAYSRNLNMELESSFFSQHGIYESSLGDALEQYPGGKLLLLNMYRELLTDDQFTSTSLLMLLLTR